LNGDRRTHPEASSGLRARVGQYGEIN